MWCNVKRDVVADLGELVAVIVYFGGHVLVVSPALGSGDYPQFVADGVELGAERV